MIHNARSCFSILGAAFVLASCATAITPQSLTGTYEVPRESGIITNARAADDDQCPQGSVMQGADMCVEPATVTDTLTVTEQPDGDLSFDVLINAFNGHSCSLNGVAQQTGPQSWRIEKAGEYTDAICKVDIVVEDGAITFQQDYDSGSDCSAYCGARAQMGGSFPLSSLQQ